MSRDPEPRNRWRPPRGSPPRPGRRSVALFLVGALLGGSLLLAWQGANHVPRIALTLLAGWGGLSLAVSWDWRPWYVRLGCLVAGLAVAAGAWWFVPTTGGGNLWRVHRLLHEVETLPAGSVREYRARLDARRAAQAEFPAYAADLDAAERAWFRRTADQAIRTAQRERERDPARASAALGRLARELEGLDLAYTVEREIADARRRIRAARREGR